MQKAPKTAIIGAHGLAGRALFEAYRGYYPDCVGTDWKAREGLLRLDLADPNTYPTKLAASGHSWAVICAAVPDYRTIEENKDTARRRNVTGTIELVRHLHIEGLKVIVFSSDAVYDGRTGGYSEDSPLGPVNEYGRQKRDLELGLQKLNGHSLILRIGRMIGMAKGNGSLADAMAMDLAAGRTIRAARDQIFLPIVLDDLHRILASLQDQNAQGILNVGGAKAYSRLEIARYLAKGLGGKEALVQDVSLDEIEGNYSRPKNLSMKCEKLLGLLSFSLTPLAACLDRVIQNYQPVTQEIRHDR